MPKQLPRGFDQRFDLARLGAPAPVLLGHAVADVIIEQARKCRADLIVLGTPAAAAARD